MIRFAGNLALGLPIEVHRGGVRGWLHASDAVRAIEASAYVKEFQAINIGHPKMLAIDELAELIRQQLGAARDLITYSDLPPRMTLRKIPTLERQRLVLGVEPQVSLVEGVPPRLQAHPGEAVGWGKMAIGSYEGVQAVLVDGYSQVYRRMYRK